MLLPVPVAVPYSLLPILVGLAVASPVQNEGVITLPLARRLNFSGPATIIERDRSRIKALVSSLSRRGVPVNTDVANKIVTYIASVGVGQPATNYDLLVDTGSSNTWVGANKRYNATSTSKDAKCGVAVSYGSGSFSGAMYFDRVSLGSGLVIRDQPIGIAARSKGFDECDGILGLGPAELTDGTLINCNANIVPTVVDMLYSQKTILASTIGVLFNPLSSNSSDGQISWGGIDPKYANTTSFVPRTSTNPMSHYWGISQTIYYGGKSIQIMSQSAGIVDTGTTLIYIPHFAFVQYKRNTGAIEDNNTGLLTVKKEQFDKLQNLTFTIGSKDYILIPDAQLWPRRYNTDIGGISGAYYLMIADAGSPFDSGYLGFTNGYAFLERFYSVYDSAGGRVGFSETGNTYLKTNQML